VDLQTHGSPIGRRLLQFLHMSETEMVVMTAERMMVNVMNNRSLLFFSDMCLLYAFYFYLSKHEFTCRNT
jgi:hypothetical protein